MADHPHHDNQTIIVCCMCGNVGFSEELFSCRSCRFRFQHSYCSSYRGESYRVEMCDWCQSERVKRKTSSSRHGESATKRPAVAVNAPSEHVSGEKKQREESSITTTAAATGRNPRSVPSTRKSTRRYKLLKDIKC